MILLSTVFGKEVSVNRWLRTPFSAGSYQGPSVPPRPRLEFLRTSTPLVAHFRPFPRTTYFAPPRWTKHRRFWEVEELPRQPILTPQENQSEEHFCSTYSRDVDERYVVRLPFKKPPLDIGYSKLRAEQVLNTVIRKLNDKPDVKKEYREFLAEYEKLGHMRQT